MKKNVGTTDRVIRLILAAACGALIAAGAVEGIAAAVLAVAAVVLAFTGLIGWCGLYVLLGINTSKTCCQGTGDCCSGKETEKKA